MPSCTACDLHQQAQTPGIPTRPYAVNGHDTALLIVGEAPGYNEDQQGCSWVGKAGHLLSKFIEACHYPHHADVWLANACRCHPPYDADPSSTNITACRPYLQHDIEALATRYKRLILFCCGRFAVRAVTGRSRLKDVFSLQGQPLSSFPKGLEPPSSQDPLVFSSYHPAILLGRRPHLVTAVQDHFRLVQRCVNDPEYRPYQLPITPLVGEPVPRDLGSYVVVDIETYGILSGREQTVFHPMKSLHIDHCPLGEQIVSVSFAIEDSDSPAGWRTYFYDWHRHRHHIRHWFHQIAARETTLLGQNIKFDICYLKANDPVISLALSPEHVTIQDTLLMSFLWYEQRPEKGLKELAKLFGLANYENLTVTGKLGTARGASDPELIFYNCLDVAATGNLFRYCEQQIRQKYGVNTPKLRPICRRMCNVVLWDVINMELQGSTIDPFALRRVHEKHEAICAEMYEVARQQGVLLSGRGSVNSTISFLWDAVRETGLQNDGRLLFTEKKRELSSKDENVNLLLAAARPSMKCYPILKAMQKFRGSQKVVTSYTNPLLRDPRKGIVSGNRLYPQWYPMPSKFGVTEGGTIQGRLSCKKPPQQTWPSEIKKCLCSRFRGGYILGYDLSQMELRIAGLLSGDPVMIEEYERGVDRHTQTTLLIWPDLDVNAPDFRSTWRQGGKTLNFLVLYMGGAAKFQETLNKDFGIWVPLEVAEDAIRSFNQKYRVFRAWQAENHRMVREQGYLVLPTGWSRSWGTGSTADKFVSEIADFPIQTIAAQIMQDAQYEACLRFQRQRLRSSLFLQIHDSNYVDIYPGEEEAVDEIMDECLTHPPLLDTLELQLGRRIPITYEKETL